MKRLLIACLGVMMLGAVPAPANAPAPASAATAEAVALDRLMAKTPAPTLDAYRLFVDASGRTPNAGLTPYALNTPLFSDYALKQRYLYLPPGLSAKYRKTGVLDLPVGAVLVKTFGYPADFRRPDEKVRSVETRLLIHRKSGWVALAYVWNEDQTQAVLKRAGKRLDVDVIDAKGQPLHIDYKVPNQNQCKECHSVSGRLIPIGPKARNLNGDYAYPEGAENQIAHWIRTGVLTGAPAPAAAPRTAVWTDPHESLDARARAYLDGNCGHCHNPKGAASNTGLFLDLEETRPVVVGMGKRPVAAGRGSGGLFFDVAPGDPDASIMVHRMESTEPGVMMPELSRSLPHAEGIALIRAWIAGQKR